MEVKIDKPYPTIKVENKNNYYASLLKEDYTGPHSELTAILLYSFQHIEKDKELENFSKIIKDVSIVEMTHLELLGETIKLLGGTVSFDIVNPLNYQKEYWTSDDVKYNTNIRDMLEINIQAEAGAIKNYQKHYLMIDDIYVRALLERIIEDEQRHLLIFKVLLENLEC